MPLLRFCIGDLATLAEPGSHPEVGGQILRTIEGRVDDFVLTTDGRRIGRLHYVFKREQGIPECQIIQHQTTKFEFVMVPAEDYSDAILKIINDNLEHRTGYPCQISTTILGRVPRGSNGKFKGVVSLL